LENILMYRLAACAAACSSKRQKTMAEPCSRSPHRGPAPAQPCAPAARHAKMAGASSPAARACRRMAGLVRHLPADSATTPQLASDSAMASVPTSTAQHLARLERDGVTIVEDVYSVSQLAEIRDALATACDEIRAALPTVAWSEMHCEPGPALCLPFTFT
jgi:hypothetical protein